ncbi:MAG: DUF928 domain-containing protein [Cyanobacteriota bacterium]|nr:DUF928 domain-containing protein [Cyanobacteriota bacterium]
MKFNQWARSTSAIAILLSPVLVGFAPNPSQQHPSVSSNAPMQVSINFPSSPGDGTRPNRTASGGARALCYVEGPRQQALPMTVLMPTNNVGTTVEEDPALLLYIPKSRIDGGEVAIVERDSDREVYLKQFDLSNKPSDAAGIVKVQLEEANLEPGKTYDWVFSPFCISDNGRVDYLGDVYVEGSFQRTELAPSQDVQIEEATTPLEKAEIYARYGIWNETLELVEQLRPSNPQEWVNLLRSVELDELAEAPYFGEAQLIAEEDESETEAILPELLERQETNRQAN